MQILCSGRGHSSDTGRPILRSRFMTEGAPGPESAHAPAGEVGPLDVVGCGVLPTVGARVRRLFWLLERLAPALGSRWAVELWCTPPVLESSLRMPPGVSPGRPIEAYWDGHRVAGEEWGEGPPIYLVHGWGGQRAHLAVFVKPLVEAGHRVVAFDLPSHNESGPGAVEPGRTP